MSFQSEKHASVSSACMLMGWCMRRGPAKKVTRRKNSTRKELSTLNAFQTRGHLVQNR